MKIKFVCLLWMLLGAVMMFAGTGCSRAFSYRTVPERDSPDYSVTDFVQSNGNAVDPAEYQFAIVYGAAHPYFNPFRVGGQAAAEDFGISEPYVVSPNAWDQIEQNQVIDSVVARGARGIAMFPADIAASNVQITKLVQSGIPVITLGGSPAEPSEATFCYATDVGGSVAFGTQQLIDKLKANGLQSGRIVHLCSALNDVNTQKRQRAIREVLLKPENAGFALYRELADTDNIELAELAINEMYSSYINQVDGIICTGYVNAQVLARTKMALDERRVVAVGIDDSKEVLEAVEAGVMYGTMMNNPWSMGYVGIYALKLLKDGYTYKDDKPFFVSAGFVLLTKDNVSEYQEMMESNTLEFASTMADEFFLPPPAKRTD